jgi:hypothetical protein
MSVANLQDKGLALNQPIYYALSLEQAYKLSPKSHCIGERWFKANIDMVAKKEIRSFPRTKLRAFRLWLESHTTVNLLEIKWVDAEGSSEGVHGSWNFVGIVSTEIKKKRKGWLLLRYTAEILKPWGATSGGGAVGFMG